MPTLAKVLVLALVAAVAVLLDSKPAEACTRAVYQGPEDRVLTGRTMDWKFDWEGNLWILPRGVERSGLAGPRSVNWTSQYGSVIVTGYDLGTSDGLNEAGLMVNAL